MSDAWRSLSLGRRWTPGSPCPNVICPPEVLHCPTVPRSYGLPPIWRESQTGVSRLLTSAPDQDKDITISIPERPRSPGPFITAGGWDGCNYRSHRLSSARGFRQEHTPPTPGRFQELGGGGLAALCHVLPRHAPGPPSQCCSIWWKVGRPRGAGKDVEALPSGPRQSWIQMACLTSPGAGRARLGHSRQPARAPGAVRTEAASRPTERLPFPAACGWLSPHPRDHPTLVSGAQSSALREATCRQ